MTLLDVAVAVVIVSLLLSSVVRGNELIESAHTKRISTEISNITAAFLIYQDRYRSIPGDDAGATMRWAEAKSGNGDGVLSGHYDDLPVDASALVVGQTEGESLNFWWHLRLAALVPGAQLGAGAASPPTHALGGRMGTQQAAFGMPGPVLCFEGIPQQMASVIDRQFDDAIAGSGSLRAGSVDSSVPAYQVNGADVTMCASLNGSRMGGSGPLYPASAMPGSSGGDSSAASQAVTPGSGNPNGGNSNGRRNGQNGTGPGNNGNGSGNLSNTSNQSYGFGQGNRQGAMGPSNNDNGEQTASTVAIAT
jgi:hypothetical protein